MDFLPHTAIEEDDCPTSRRRGFSHVSAPLTGLRASSRRPQADSSSRAMIATGNTWKQTRTAEAPLAAILTACESPRIDTGRPNITR